MIKAHPFLKWAGGKGQLVETLLAHFPKDFDKVKTYAENFVGGGALLFEVLSMPESKGKRFLINDFNPKLINSYICIRDSVHELIGALKELQNGFWGLDGLEKRGEYYYKQRERFNQADCIGVEQAALLIFLNKTCYNGLYRENQKGEFNTPFGKYTTNPTICAEDVLLADHVALKQHNVEIRCGDFTNLGAQASKNWFFYFDPPYRPLPKTSSFQYLKDGFNDNEQIRLADFCKKLDKRGARWLLSNSYPKNTDPDDNFFEDLFNQPQFILEAVSATRMINSKESKRGAIKEFLIRNFQ